MIGRLFEGVSIAATWKRPSQEGADDRGARTGRPADQGAGPGPGRNGKSGCSATAATLPRKLAALRDDIEREAYLPLAARLRPALHRQGGSAAWTSQIEGDLEAASRFKP